MIVFSCPTCQKAMQVPPAMAGQPVSCPFCHNGVIVPPAVFPPPPAHQPNPLSLDDAASDPEEDAADERRARARRATVTAKQKRNAHIYLWGGLLLMAVMVVCVVGLAPSLAKDARGSRRITTDELLAVKDPDQLSSPWVQYTPEQPVIDTGLVAERKSRRGGSKITSRFVLVPVKDKWMIADVEPGAKGSRLEGKLAKWEFELGPEAIEKIKAQHPDKKDKLLPFQFGSDSDPESHVIFPVVAMGVMLLFGAGCTIYGYVSLPRARARTARR